MLGIPPLRMIQAARARRKLADFVRYAWPTIEPGTPLLWSWHIDAICEHLEAVTEGDIRKLLINVPPGSMKSLIVSVAWPAWQWIKRPNMRSLFSSYAIELALRDSVRCRDLITSDWYLESFEPAWSLKGDQNVKGYFENDAKGFRFSHSVGSKATGFRGHQVICDDPLNINDAHSELKRAEAIRWWDQTMPSRVNDPRAGAFVVIMQRAHDNDLAGHILKQGGYETLIIPAEYDPDRSRVTSIGWSDPRKQAGDLFFPELFPREVLDDFKKRLGPIAYAGQYQQHPVPAEGGMFKREWFRYFRTIDIAGEAYYECVTSQRRVKRSDCWRFIVADTAITEKEQSDYTVRQVWDVEKSRDSDGKVIPGAAFIIDQWRERKLAVDVERALRNDLQSFAPLFVGVEDWAGSKHLIQMWQRDGLPVRPVKADRDKVTRAIPLQTMMANGRVYTPLDAQWRADFEDEVLKFPLVDHDDQVDATAHGATFAQHRNLWEAPEKKPLPPNAIGRILGHDRLLNDNDSKPASVFALDRDREATTTKFNSW